MMIDFLRKSLEFFRIIPRTDLVALITPTHPTPDQIKAGEMTIVRDGIDKWACFACPGGCGETIMLSLSKNRRPRWTVSLDLLNRPSVSPSVRQLTECGCHFWVTDGRILWCKDMVRTARSR